MVDTFDTYVLNRVVDNMVDRTSFLVDTFFPEVQVSEQETILFDVTQDRKLVTPFVSSFAEGPLISGQGYETDSFRPAYAKDKRVFDPKKTGRRLPGETIGGSLTRQQRLDRAIRSNMDEQISMLNLRFEVMAGDVLYNGTETISGERYPTRVVDFKRRSANKVVLSGGNTWAGTPTKTPWKLIEDEAQELSDATGYMPTDVIFTPEAWAPFYADAVANHKNEIDKTLANGGLTEVLMGYINQPRDGVVYRGKSGYLRFWTYSGTYTDPEDMQTKRILPAGAILMGGATVDGVRHFGAIEDLASLQARQYFVKSWEENDPSRRYLLMQSAPLLVPYRVNNIKALQVL